MFPDSIMDVLEERLITIDGVTNVFQRDIAPTDPNGSLGIVYELWTPGSDIEMGQRYSTPTLGNYHIVLTHMVKHTNREEGEAQHRLVAHRIRSMLYRDAETQLALAQLRDQTPDYTERMMKWGIEQRFAAGNIKGSFYFASDTTVIFETETV